MSLSTSAVKPYAELLLAGLFILAFGATNLPIFMLGVVLLGLVVAMLLPFGRSIQFIIFMLPSLEVFTKTPYVSVSLATLICLAIFGRYIFTQLLHTSYYRPGLMLTLVFIIFELAHMIYNPVMLSSQTVRWLIMFSFFALIMFDRKRYINFDRLRMALLIGLLVSTGYGLLQKYLFPPEYLYLKAFVRFSGGAGDPNNFGLYCLLLIFFFLPNVPRQGIKLTSFIVMIIMIACGALTVSRSFFLVAVGSLFLYFLFYFRAAIGDLLFRTLIFILLGIVMGGVYFLSGQSLEFNLDIFSRFSGNNMSELTGARSDILKEYLSQYFDLPMTYILFGVGINGYLGYFNYLFAKQALFPEVVGPHNTILEIMISFGLIGSLIIIAFVYQAFKSEKLKSNQMQIYRIALIPVVVFTLYCFSLQNLAKYGSYFILMLIIYNTYRKDH